MQLSESFKNFNIESIKNVESNMHTTKVVNAFKSYFGDKPDHLVKAPGRVNLIGEHTDYNNGFVFPCAIEFYTYVGISRREDLCVEIIALDLNDQDTFSLEEHLTPHPTKTWVNYIKGVINELTKLGKNLSGFNLVICGDIPQGAGLSSSASLEVAVAKAISKLHSYKLNRIKLAQIAQAAENNFVGCNCGIMDQLISACGIRDNAIAIDCNSYTLTKVTFPKDLAIMIVDSSVKRGLVESEYNLRREQCEQVADYFSVKSLRQVPLDVFNSEKARINPTLVKRAQHVLEENQRVLAMIGALNIHDLPSISRLMAESHQSLKTLFEVTVPEVDYLVKIISEELGSECGVRMTGGGFGGCIVVILPQSRVDALIPIIKDKYKQEMGLDASIYLSTPAQGVKALF
ncbi:galactokinase [Thalassotalea crassostreae]|uniref:galactokinase n=2 Tax=Thalassotalea crassostreae TaxID=1763536 RepID=UPI000AC1F24A|nr:galactokinase [Thalassotalea crassostreae]